jgi:hypothetical protein
MANNDWLASTLKVRICFPALIMSLQRFSLRLPGVAYGRNASFASEATIRLRCSESNAATRLFFSRKVTAPAACLYQCGDTHNFDTTGWTNHKWLRPTDKKVENVLFDWRVEAADKWDSGISKGSGQIVSFEYDATGAFDRTEETKQIHLQNIKVTNRPEIRIVYLKILFVNN